MSRTDTTGLRPAVVSVGVLLGVGAALAAPSGPRHVQASLVAEADAAVPGQSLQVGLRLRMEPGWHTYWRNPGDSGLPTRVKWDLPEGFSAGPIQWPRPIRFRTGPLMSFGYEDEVLLPMEIQVPAALSSAEARLSAQVRWLECREVCLPGKAELALVLPVRPQAAAGPAAALFREARGRMPVADGGWTFSASAGDGAIELTVGPPHGVALLEAYFYPLTPRVLDHSKPQSLAREGSGYRMELPLRARAEPPRRLEGVLVGTTPKGPVGLVVDVAP